MLVGKTVLVTGGSRGIGRETCLEFARRGAHVAFCYAGNEDAALQTLKAVHTLDGVEALALRADCTSEQDVETLVDAVVKHFGCVDILVNNAGITRDNLCVGMTLEQFDAVVDTNLRGAFLCMKHAGKKMVQQRYGRIVNISSVVGLRGNPGQINYAASKAGLIGMTKTLARELAGRNVTVNAVAPGFIRTDMTDTLDAEQVVALTARIPSGCLGKPEDVARAVCFLASDEAAYITGQVLCVDGGMAM